LNRSVSLIDGMSSFGDRFFFVRKEALNALNSLIVIVNFNIQNINSFK
jgi:hypothetical protein